MMKSCYNKSAWDLARDELDAANNIVTSRVEIRQVLEDHEASQKLVLFSSGGGVSQGDGSIANRPSASGCG